ncbi:MAG: hypothetical protein V4643_10850 [Bacteroidota bacterium]
MNSGKKFGVMILFFDCEQFILKTIENCAPFVDKIYISYSPQPWSAYNAEAPSLYANRSNPEILKQSVYFDKLELVQGVWETEEAQRNACRTKAIADGMDYLIVQDADEFYLPETYQQNIDEILANPQYNMYQCPWMIFWKDTKHVILHREHLGERNTIYAACPLFAINLHVDNPFTSRRLTKDIDNKLILQGMCFHLSYVFSDEEMVRKINTWGHSHQVNKNWLRWKWLAWNPQTKYLNPFNSTQWIKAVPYTGKLPKELIDFPTPPQTIIPLSLSEQIKCNWQDAISLCSFQLRQLSKQVKRLLKN